MHTKHCFTNYKNHKITWKSIKMLKYSHSWFHGIFIFLYQSTSGNNILEFDAKCSRLSTDRDKSTTLMPRGYGNAIEGFIFFFIFTSCHKFNFRPTVPRTATMWYSSLWKSLAVLTQALRQRNPSHRFAATALALPLLWPSSSMLRVRYHLTVYAISNRGMGISARKSQR